MSVNVALITMETYTTRGSNRAITHRDNAFNLYFDIYQCILIWRAVDLFTLYTSSSVMEGTLKSLIKLNF